MNLKNKSNCYVEVVGRELFESCPKTVLAAIAVSALTCGGDHLSKGVKRLLWEWWCLYESEIVPQKPPFPKPSDAEEPTCAGLNQSK